VCVSQRRGKLQVRVASTTILPRKIARLFSTRSCVCVCASELEANATDEKSPSGLYAAEKKRTNIERTDL